MKAGAWVVALVLPKKDWPIAETEVLVGIPGMADAELSMTMQDGDFILHYNKLDLIQRVNQEAKLVKDQREAPPVVTMRLSRAGRIFRSVSVVQEEGDSVSGIVAFGMRERAVWLVLEAWNEVLQAIAEEVKAQEYALEVRNLEIDALSSDALRFQRDESVELQLLPSEALLYVPLSTESCRTLQSRARCRT